MKKALIVVDMQNDNITGPLSSDASRSIVCNVVSKLRIAQEEGEDIIFLRDTHQLNYLSTQEGKKLPIIHCLENSVGWQLDERMRGIMHTEPEIINKPTFGSLMLMERLKELQPDEIEFVGLYTDICVLVNVMLAKTNFPEAIIVVDSRCVAGTSEEAHNAALVIMKSCQIDIK